MIFFYVFLYQRRGKEEKEGLVGAMDRLKKHILFNVKGVDPEKFTAAVFKIEGSRSEVLHQRANLKTLAIFFVDF